jgi:hypothetical protein
MLEVLFAWQLNMFVSSAVGYLFLDGTGHVHFAMQSFKSRRFTECIYALPVIGNSSFVMEANALLAMVWYLRYVNDQLLFL